MNVSDLDLDVDFLCGSTSATYTPTNKRRNMNIAYRDVARIIWEADGGWNYDDSNATTLPKAYTTLVHNQQDYTLPTNAQRVERIEVLDANGNYLKLTPLDKQEVTTGLPEFLGGNPGTPVAYELVGRSILLYPTPHSAMVTETAGLTIYMQRDITDLPVTATTTEPGFASPFHRILSYAAAIDFVQDPDQRNFLVRMKTRIEEGLVRFYSKRAPEIKTKIKPGGRKKWRNYT
jgi:hypothetical protein